MATPKHALKNETVVDPKPAELLKKIGQAKETKDTEPKPVQAAPAEEPKPAEKDASDEKSAGDSENVGAKVFIPLTKIPLTKMADATKEKKPKRKKRRKARTDVNVEKQKQMAVNERMVAWKLACREQGYFRHASFSRLPERNTEEWKKIWLTRTNLLNKFWRRAVAQAGLKAKYGCLTAETIDSVKEITKRKRKVITIEDPKLKEVYDLMQTEDYKKILGIQREFLSALYTKQRLQQSKQVSTTWKKAVDNCGNGDILGDTIIKPGTSEYKAKMQDPVFAKAFADAKVEQKKIWQKK